MWWVHVCETKREMCALYLGQTRKNGLKRLKIFPETLPGFILKGGIIVKRVDRCSLCGSVGLEPNIVSVRMWVWSLALLNELRSRIATTCGIGRKFGSDLALLWLWCRPFVLAAVHVDVWSQWFWCCAASSRRSLQRRLSKMYLVEDPHPITSRRWYPSQPQGLEFDSCILSCVETPS